MTEPKHKGLYAALAAAQGEMGRALKDTDNPHFESKYADLSSVMDACMPALSKHGIAVLQPAFDDDTGRYVKTIFVHGESGETVECRVPLIVAQNNMQGYGSAVTYARRYGLMGMAGIAPEDDDGNAAAKAPPLADEKRKAPPSDTRRDPAAIAKSLIEAIGKAATAADLEAMNADGTKFAKAWEWLVDEKHTAQAAAIRTAFDERMARLNNADINQDEIPY